LRSVGPFHTIAFGMNEAVLVGPDSLLERELEVERVRGILRAVGRREGHVVEGPAGIGKSRLLEIARTRASDLGFRVLSARATELEQGFPFGVVRQLFERVITRPRARTARRSATGSVTARNSCTWPSPSSSCPAEVAISAATLRPCQASGITGSGGAVVRLAGAVTSSDAPGAQARNACSRSASASAG